MLADAGIRTPLETGGRSLEKKGSHGETKDRNTGVYEWGTWMGLDNGRDEGVNVKLFASEGREGYHFSIDKWSK